MKLHTSIKPRRDGTVKVTGQDSQTYVFVAGADGELSCDVSDEATIAHLLGTDNFYPADFADAEFAASLLIAEVDDADDADDADDEQATALPVEANTPPVRRKPGPKPKAR